MIEQKQLPDSAIQYFRKTLADGDRLAQYLLRLELELGTPSAFLPSEVDVREITDFENQDDFLDRYPGTGEDRESQVRQLVFSYLKADSANMAVWEGWPEKPDQPDPRSDEIGYFWNADGIWGVWDRPGGTRSPSRSGYAYVTNADERKIQVAFGHAREYPTVCALTVRPKTGDFESPPFTAPDSLLADLAASTRHILVGAFDERGLLIWTRH